MISEIPDKYIFTPLAFVILFYGSFSILLFYSNSLSPKVTINHDKVIISRGHSRTIPLSQINNITMFPYEPMYRTNKHFGNAKARKGHFKTPNNTMIHVHLGKADPPIIKIDVTDDDPSYLSLESTKETKELFDRISKELDSFQK